METQHMRNERLLRRLAEEVLRMADDVLVQRA